MPGTCFIATAYHSQRHIAQIRFLLASLVLNLSQDVRLGKGSDGTFTTLRYSFYLFSAASWKVYNVLLKSVRWIFFLPPSDVHVRSFPYTSTLIKSLLYQALSDWDCIFGPGVKSSTSEATNSTPTTLRYQIHKLSWDLSSGWCLALVNEMNSLQTIVLV